MIVRLFSWHLIALFFLSCLSHVVQTSYCSGIEKNLSYHNTAYFVNWYFNSPLQRINADQIIRGIYIKNYQPFSIPIN